MKKKLIQEAANSTELEIMISGGCSVVDLIAALDALVKQHGDSAFIQKGGSYHEYELALDIAYDRPETDEEFATRKARSIRSKKSAAKRKETLRKKKLAEMERLLKQVARLEKQLEEPA